MGIANLTKYALKKEISLPYTPSLILTPNK